MKVSLGEGNAKEFCALRNKHIFCTNCIYYSSSTTHKNECAIGLTVPHDDVLDLYGPLSLLF